MKKMNMNEKIGMVEGNRNVNIGFFLIFAFALHIFNVYTHRENCIMYP